MSKNLLIFTILISFAIIFQACGGGGLGILSTGWQSNDSSESNTLTNISNSLLINGSVDNLNFQPNFFISNQSYALNPSISSHNFSLEVIDNDNINAKIGSIKFLQDNKFQAVLPITNAYSTPIILVKDNSSQRIIYRYFLGRIPKLSEIPSQIDKIVINGIKINEISTTRSLFAIEKNISNISMLSINFNDIKDTKSIELDFSNTKTNFENEIDNLAGGTNNIIQLSNAMLAVATIMLERSINDTIKDQIIYKNIDSISKLLESYIKCLNNNLTRQIIITNRLSESIKVNNSIVNSSTNQNSIKDIVNNITPLLQLNPPEISPKSGTYENEIIVTITSNVSGVVIKYTTDGSIPSLNNGFNYVGPITIDKSTKIIAIATKQGYADSKPQIANYQIPLKVETPIITPNEGNYTTPQEIKIMTNTSGAIIKYTVDGSIPSIINGLTYTQPFIITSSTTIKAIAIKEGMRNSNIKVANYVILSGKAEQPTFNPPAGQYSTTQNIVISTATEGAIIKYTIDGSEPSVENGLIYKNPIEIKSSCVIKAIAIKEGMQNSNISTAIYTIMPKLNKPIFIPNGGTFNTSQSVSIVSDVKDATIFYTLDGSEPSVLSLRYTSPVLLTSTTTIKAIVIKSQMTPSDVESATFTILPKVSKPKFNLPEGKYEGKQFITITSDTPNALIYYTLNGETPTNLSNLYQTPIEIKTPTLIKAIAVKNQMDTSEVESAFYDIKLAKVKSPIFSPNAGIYNNTQSVTITSNTSNALIYYTLNGETPTNLSNLYQTPITISKTTTIKAIAVKEDMETSEVVTATYVIDRTLPTFEIEYFNDENLTLSLGNSPYLSEGTYYIKITSNKELKNNPTLSINAEGTLNDVTNASTTKVTDFIYKFKRVVIKDELAVGSVKEDFSISATDLANNIVSNANPINENLNAAYIDTTPPKATIIYKPEILNIGKTLTCEIEVTEKLNDSFPLKISINGALNVEPTLVTKVNDTKYIFTITPTSGSGIAYVQLLNAKDYAGNLITQTPISGESFNVVNTQLIGGTYKKVLTLPSNLNEAFLDDNNLLKIKLSDKIFEYNIENNESLKNIMIQFADGNTFTVDDNGKISEIDISISGGETNLLINANECTQTVIIKGHNTDSLTISSNNANQNVNFEIKNGNIDLSSNKLIGTITLNGNVNIISGTKNVITNGNYAFHIKGSGQVKIGKGGSVGLIDDNITIIASSNNDDYIVVTKNNLSLSINNEVINSLIIGENTPLTQIQINSKVNTLTLNKANFNNLIINNSVTTLNVSANNANITVGNNVNNTKIKVTNGTTGTKINVSTSEVEIDLSQIINAGNYLEIKANTSDINNLKVIVNENASETKTQDLTTIEVNPLDSNITWKGKSNDDTPNANQYTTTTDSNIIKLKISENKIVTLTKL